MTASSRPGCGNAPGRIAVVLFGQGGPDGEDAVRPFLFNRLADPSVSRLPNPFRTLLASFLSGRQAGRARAVHARLGGGSPLLEGSRAQAAALEAVLAAGSPAGEDNPDLAGAELRTFIAMRHWHPMSLETAAEVKAYGPGLILLLPLHPQFSTGTTASSVRAWREAAETLGLTAPTRLLCCHPTEAGFIDAMAAPIRPLYDKALAHGRPRLLFSAPGVSEMAVKRGDPYRWQCERTAESIAAALGAGDPEWEPDWVTCFQGQAGVRGGIGPSTEEEIRRAGRDGVPVLLVPIAFLSECPETLADIDVECRRSAMEAGVPHFARVPAAGTAPVFIAGLARLVRLLARSGAPFCAQNGGRLCPPGFLACPQQRQRPY